jgi:hypothetical protein
LQSPTWNNKYKHLKKYLHVNKLIINLQLKQLLNLSNTSAKVINQSNKKSVLNYFQNSNFFNLETIFTTKALAITGTPISRNKYNLSSTNDWKYECIQPEIILIQPINKPKFSKISKLRRAFKKLKKSSKLKLKLKKIHKYSLFLKTHRLNSYVLKKRSASMLFRNRKYKIKLKHAASKYKQFKKLNRSKIFFKKKFTRLRIKTLKSTTSKKLNFKKKQKNKQNSPKFLRSPLKYKKSPRSR